MVTDAPVLCMSCDEFVASARQVPPLRELEGTELRTSELEP